MGALLVVGRHPVIEAGLQHLGALAELLAEDDALELVEHGLVEALADAVGLRAARPGPGVVDVLGR